MMFRNLDLASKPNLWGSCRLSIAFCVFLASVQMAILRDNLGIALLCMSKPVGNLTCEPNDAIVPTLPWLDLKQVCVTMITYPHDFVYHRYINKCVSCIPRHWIFVLNSWYVNSQYLVTNHVYLLLHRCPICTDQNINPFAIGMAL